MRTLISAVALALAFAVSAQADDTVKSKPDPAKPGRAIEEGAVTSGADGTSKHGCKIDDGTVKMDKKASTKKHGRAIDGAKKKKAAVEEKQGRALDEVKSGKDDTTKQGRAVGAEKK
ncbi:MAG: hypothetical protein EXR36_12040 [Betaproteobacteria bacterium]|nr:hypothetical protein [Betaproteobacteria bacterium]